MSGVRNASTIFVATWSAGRRSAGGHSARGHGVGGVAVGAREEHHELVAAHPRDRVFRAELALEAGGEHAKELVAARVAERVVHELEIVHVEEDERERLLVPARVRQRHLHAIGQERAVRQPGEAVVERHVADRALGLLAVGDVAPGAEHEGTPPDFDDAGVHLDGERRLALHRRVLRLEDKAPELPERLHPLRGPFGSGRGGEIAHPHVEDVLASHASPRTGDVVRVDDAAVQVVHDE